MMAAGKTRNRVLLRMHWQLAFPEVFPGDDAKNGFERPKRRIIARRGRQKEIVATGEAVGVGLRDCPMGRQHEREQQW
jgi:hypothetical protein